MSDVIEREPVEGADGGLRPGAGEYEVTVKAGVEDFEVVRIGHGHAITLALTEIALKRDIIVEEVEIFRDGELEALTEVIIVDEAYPRHHTHHVHRKENLLVTVYYGGQDRTKEFKRRATINHVLEWSIKEFHIDPSLASEMELALHGSETELPGDEHVGHLAGKHKTLALDLIRGKISNG
jgi:hypothetical protein